MRFQAQQKPKIASFHLKCQTSSVQNPFVIPLYWLVDRDSPIGLFESPIYWVVQSTIIINQQRFWKLLKCRPARARARVCVRVLAGSAIGYFCGSKTSWSIPRPFPRMGVSENWCVEHDAPISDLHSKLRLKWCWRQHLPENEKHRNVLGL